MLPVVGIIIMNMDTIYITFFKAKSYLFTTYAAIALTIMVAKFKSYCDSLTSFTNKQMNAYIEILNLCIKKRSDGENVKPQQNAVLK